MPGRTASWQGGAPGSSRERAAVNRSLAASVLSATALSGLVGGRLADSCGNEYLFFMTVVYAAVTVCVVVPVAIIGGCKSCLSPLFFLNQTMLWAVMVLMFSTVIIKVVEPAYGTFWQNRVADRGLSKDASFLVAKTFEKGADTLRAPVLGALMTAVGQTLACTFLGLAVAALSAVFALVTGIAAKGQRSGESASTTQ